VSGGTPELDAALAEVRSVLDRDGFTADWDETEEGVVFRVGVGAPACDDCLVPRAVLALMVGSALEPTGRRLARLEMPGE
jgi:hypothetical protein